VAGASVQRVVAALAGAGLHDRVVALAGTAHRAEDAAAACGVPLGAIVKSLVFEVGEVPVVALVAGDRRCAPAALPAALGLAGEARRCPAERVRAVTGFAIGGVAPVGHLTRLPTAIDSSLGRFERLFAAAGHPRCVFETSLDELVALTGGRLVQDLAAPALGD
jgi:prolyl-tRNA editing enzyme YbaK/EbsC (Cys-tRNA(Pro) deacylase)